MKIYIFYYILIELDIYIYIYESLTLVDIVYYFIKLFSVF